jgi:hypothetical protein
LNLTAIDENIKLPSLLSLTIGKVVKTPAVGEDGKIRIANVSTIKLTGVSTAFSEDDLISFLSTLCNIIEYPLNISL